MAKWEAAECGAASQVIDRPPAEVFRFVATEHFQNHPEWDPVVTSITQTSPGPMGLSATARLIPTDRGRQPEGSMEVTEYQPVSSSTVVSRFGPFTLQARATFAPVAPTGTRLQLVIKPRPAGSWGLLLPLMKRGVPQGQCSGVFAASNSRSKPQRRRQPDHLEPSGTLACHVRTAGPIKAEMAITLRA